MGAPVDPIWQQQDYAFYSDGTESGATIIGSAGSQQTLDTGTVYHCRLAIAETNGANKSPLLTLLWQYNRNSGGWTTITGSTPVQFVDNANLTDGGATTNRQPTGTGTFRAGRVYETANTTATCYTSSGNDHTEAVLHFQIDAAQVTDGDEILIRCVEGTGTVFGGTYTNADIDVNKPAATWDQDSFAFYEETATAVYQQTDSTPACDQSGEEGDARLDGTAGSGTVSQVITASGGLGAFWLVVDDYTPAGTSYTGTWTFSINVTTTDTNIIIEPTATHPTTVREYDDCTVDTIFVSRTDPVTGGYWDAQVNTTGVKTFSSANTSSGTFDGDTARLHCRFVVINNDTSDHTFAFTSNQTIVAPYTGLAKIGATNADPELELDTTYCVRFLVQQTNATGYSNAQLKLQYKVDAGSWTDVTAASSNVRSTTTAALTNQAPTRQRIGAGTYVAANSWVDNADGGIGDGTDPDFSGNDECECISSFQLRSADLSGTETIYLRVVLSDGTPLDTYTNTPAITIAAAGITGTLNKTLGTLTLSADGSVDVAGALDETLGTLTLSSDGSVDIVGTLNETLGTLTLSAEGSVLVQGTLDETLGTLTLSADGTAQTQINGTLDTTLGTLTLSADGDVDVTGTLDETLGTLTLSSAGSVDVTGALNETLGTLTLSADGSVLIQGTLDETLGAVTLFATGSGGINGALDEILGTLILSADGSILIAGALDATLDALTLSSAGSSGGVPVPSVSKRSKLFLKNIGRGMN